MGTLHLITLTILINIGLSNSGPAVLTYEGARNAVIEAEETIMTGGRILLSPQEKEADLILMKAKDEEINFGLKNPDQYPPGMHFFKAKPLIEKSKVFKFLKEMPKGALLHGHNTAMVSSEWVVKELTYYPNLLKCINSVGVTILAFRESPEHLCTSYVKVADERAQANDIVEYDKSLESTMNLYTPTPEVEYPHIQAVWDRFQNMFWTIGDILSYLPAYKAYHTRLLEEMYEDGVIYIEFRTSFSLVYDDKDRKYSRLEVLEIMKELIDDFKMKNPGFYGAKAIYSTSRKTTPTSVQERINTFRELYSAHPEFVVGFDLVGQEDLGEPLYDFIKELKTLPEGAQFFFHAGETNWYGGSTDYNLLDAVLLNTTRIGHGYALMKHPVLWNAVKSRGVGIEVSPISNQVLHLLWDMRNHPAAFFVSENIPMIICNDDPGFWNAKGLSYDFYYAFMSFAPNDAGINYLKQLVWNSIKYSAFSKSEREKASALLQLKWGKFIEDVIAGKVI